MDVADEIQRLQQLHKAGALTAAEFTEAKAAVLNKASTQSEHTGGRAGCYKCDAGSSTACQLCGQMFCTEHGGERAVWVDSTGGTHGARHTLTKRVICDDCTPDPATVKRKIKLLIFFFVLVFGFMIVGMILTSAAFFGFF